MAILLTGGAGFIGSHTAVSLLNAGLEIIIVDNLYNSAPKVIDRIETITGKRPAFVEADCCDKAAMDKVFSDYDITGVIHFAGLKAVGESVQKPLLYYRNNLDSTLTVLEVMRAHNCHQFVFPPPPPFTATSPPLCMRRRRPATAPTPTAGRSS